LCEKARQKNASPMAKKNISSASTQGQACIQKTFKGTATSMGDGAIIIFKGLNLSDSHCTALTVTSYISANLTPGTDLLHG
jgi:hypothetical protein